ncbi:alpha/beta hydrolase family protein [Joostella sp. CR20]|uniref:alpha/beta hydrolase family protein n=1 Tax=Joostella sp. CR20 TaxID=2804312 RepID=UPI00313AB15D
MQIHKNIAIKGKHVKPIYTDIYFNETQTAKPVALFCHGYKGFKDWGFWEIVAETFVAKGYVFVKFNLSHNGIDIEKPTDFTDLDGFGNNNFSIELDDIDEVLNWIYSAENSFSAELNTSSITLIGHSRGGGISIIKAAEDTRITKLITWASVSDFKARFADEKARAYWKQQGVIYIENSRTKQQLPHFYQFYEDFIANETRFTIKNSAEKINIPWLIIHGTNDPTVILEEAQALHQWNPESNLLVIEEADHVFGGQHPWEEKKLPQHMQQVVEASISF